MPDLRILKSPEWEKMIEGGRSVANEQHFSLYLFDGCFTDETAGCIRLDGVTSEELSVLLALLWRQTDMDMVIRPCSCTEGTKEGKNERKDQAFLVAEAAGGLL